MKVAYFVHEVADAAVRRRVRMIEAGGGSVRLLGFHRQREGAAPPVDATVLGHTHNQRLFSRVLSVVTAAPRAWNARRRWRDADVFVARNLEMLLLVILLTRGRTARVVYECLDIHRLMTADGIAGKLLRLVERICLTRTDLLITSSPAFVRHHFESRQHFRGDILLTENKLLCLNMVAHALHRPETPPYVIAWCGILRCKRSFELLSDLASRSAGRVRVELWGAPAKDQIPKFDDVLARTPYITFHDRYAAEDLPRIYGAAHFAWAIDFFEAGANSDWLLPNRLYESLAFGAVPIALAQVETGRWLEAHDVGVTLPCPLETALPDFLDQMTPDRFGALQARARAIDPLSVMDTSDTCRAFVTRLAGRTA